MFSTFFVNICILVTFLYITGLISQRYKIRLHTLKRKVHWIGGALFGCYGIVLMYYSFHVGFNTIADLRHLAIIATATYIGGPAALIATLFVCLGRLLLFGVTTQAIVGAFFMMLVGIGCALLSHLSWSRLPKLVIMNIFALGVIFFPFMINLNNNIDAVLHVYPLHFVISMAGGFLLYLIAESINTSNELLLRLEHTSYTDHLTNLSNRRQLESSLEEQLPRARQRHEHLSVLVLDIDHFKEVNDTYGHAAGDAVLRQLGQILIDKCRSNDIVTRSGGEEFTVLLPNCTFQQALRIANQILSGVNQYEFVLADRPILKVTVSIGVTTFPDTGGDISGAALLEQADKALYEAKHAGRNRICSYEI
ncbi:GGDEF domain-containing protein [Paenibacillus kribbensis]|uniref:GGDEF domain-containing protein n=1 Tax=Paenibacillus kribbensis TaxID=172713 RepID=A0A222WGG7_9BACL|nr:diguanylate cyclase [Paenibacillus kribbensis]ASR45460.1 GGDEF domain-containing protein [Paenibacillus kribbensis]